MAAFYHGTGVTVRCVYLDLIFISLFHPAYIRRKVGVAFAYGRPGTDRSKASKGWITVLLHFQSVSSDLVWSDLVCKKEFLV